MSSPGVKKECWPVPDIVSPETRRRMMAGIKGKDTKPELFIRRALHARGLRFRLYNKKLPGKPDLSFPKYRAIVLVNGCFWHGHSCHLFKWPSTRKDFWRKKILRNMEKDREVLSALRQQGWRVAVIYECALKGKTRLDPETVIDETENWIRSDSAEYVIEGRKEKSEGDEKK